MTVSVGKAAGGSSFSWSKKEPSRDGLESSMICIYVGVHMETASEVKSFTFEGRCPRSARSSSIWFESLVWLGQRVITRESL